MLYNLHTLYYNIFSLIFIVYFITIIMNIESFREYCLNKKGVSESFPFNETVLVFKVLDKMFALTDLDSEFKISLKCEPKTGNELREKYKAVDYAYHFNKKHWISVRSDGSLSNTFIEDLIDHSYDQVVLNMTKKKQKELFNL